MTVFELTMRHLTDQGRWTKEEHTAFLDGLKLHGREWKKIASMIPTRTVVQIRTHAQKFFQKQAKTEGRSIDHEMRSGGSEKKKLKLDAPRSRRSEDANGDGFHDAKAISAAAGGVTPRTVAAATILLAPRFQSDKAAPHTSQWMAQQSANAAAVLDAQRVRRTSPRLGAYSLPPSWPGKQDDLRAAGSPPLFKPSSQAVAPEPSDMR
jgi:SHAQKYF class myb-like DNA-binding protein